MSISVVEPVSRAIERTKYILFQPFDLEKWMKLGFCAFLATLGEGGGGPSGGGGGPSGGGGGGHVGDGDQVWQWVQENMTLIISIVAAVLVVGCVLGLVMTWLSSRGKFMLIDGIVKNRGAVVGPWREYRREGNSLFCFRIIFGLCGFGGFLLLLGACVGIAWPSIQAQEFGSSAGIALAIGVPTLILFAITLGLIHLCLTHFVVPIMYRRRSGVMAAWSEFRHQILAGHISTFVLYVLFQIVIGLAVGVIAMLATCLTCCLAAIPYVGSVILLPLFVFMESYHLYFLEQFGPKWIFFQDKPEPVSAVLADEPPSPFGPHDETEDW